MDFEILFAGIAISELTVARPWYVALLGRDPDIVVSDAELMWRVSDEGWVYLVENPGRCGKSLVTLSVFDLDDALTNVARRGVPAPTPEVVEGAGRKATFVDPDGNRVTIVEVSAASEETP